MGERASRPVRLNHLPRQRELNSLSVSLYSMRSRLRDRALGRQVHVASAELVGGCRPRLRLLRDLPPAPKDADRLRSGSRRTFRRGRAHDAGSWFLLGSTAEARQWRRSRGHRARHRRGRFTAGRTRIMASENWSGFSFFAWSNASLAFARSLASWHTAA